MFDNKTYDEVRAYFLAGSISKEAWQDYCKELLFKIMADNASVFKRLKNR